MKRYLRSAFPTELVNKIIDDASYWPHSSVCLERPLTAEYGDGDKMYMRTLPLCIPGTEGDFSLVKDDFKTNGAAWTKKLTLGRAGGPLYPRTLLHPCRKIEFQLWSHDQGWGGGHPGTYQASYTWFDVSTQNLQTSIFSGNTIEWPSSLLFEQSGGELCSIPTDPKPHIPADTTLQRNVVAKGETTVHTIVWHYLDSYDKDSAEAREAANQGRGPGTLDGRFVRSMQVGDCIILWVRARFPGWENHVEKAKITVYWMV